jgi:hypothetical protein
MIENEGCFHASGSDVWLSRLKSRNLERSNSKLFSKFVKNLIVALALITEVPIVNHDVNLFQDDGAWTKCKPPVVK